MTRKDYILIARAVRDFLGEIAPLVPSNTLKRIAEITVRCLSHQLSSYRNFDGGKFCRAAMVDFSKDKKG